MAFAGLRGTGSWGTDERPKNFREGILWKNPNGTAPIFAMLSKAKKRSVNDPEFAWWEETLDNVRVTINDGTGYSAASTTMTIDSGGLLLVAGDLLLVEKTETATYDNEVMEVSSITNDTTIVVKRGAANTTAAGMADDTALTRIGSAVQEGSSLPAISQRNPTKVLNYTQIFRTVYGSTKTALNTFARTGDPYKVDKKRKAFDHSNKIEWAFLMGPGYEDTSGDFPKRFTKGLRKFITTNVKIYTTSPTEDDFLDTVSPLFDYAKDTEAGNERVVVCGNGFMNEWNKLMRNSSSTTIQYDGVMKVYGMDLQRWVLPQGVLGIKTHPLMGTHPVFKYSAYILDMSNMSYVTLRDTKFEDDVQTPGDDARKGVWTTECGLSLEHEMLSGYIGNFII